MNETLEEILSYKPGWGSFTRIGKAPDGSDQIQHFCHATAIGSLVARGRYQKIFGVPLPKDIQRLHPIIIAKLCRLSCDTGIDVKTLITEWRTSMGYGENTEKVDLGDLVSGGGRLVPMPKHWKTLWNMLVDKKQSADGSWNPALPLILAGWNFSDDREKRARFMEHLEWAISHGQINEVREFLTSLDDQDWFFGEK